MPVREGFFAFLEDVSMPGDGFALMGGAHLAMLGLMAVLIAALCVFYKRLAPDKRRTMIRAIAIAMLTLETAKQLSLPIIHKQYWVEQLPLHLCGLSIAIEFIHAFFPGKTSGEILYSLGLPGAVAALMFSNWSMYPLANFYCLQSFFIHALHVAFPLMLLIAGELKPQAKQLWRVALFLAFAAIPIYYINTQLSTNFFFINAGSEGSPLEIFINWLGAPWFLLPYAGLVAFIWLLMYTPWVLKNMKTKKARDIPA